MFKSAVIGLGNIGMMYDLEPQRPHPSSHVYAFEYSSEYQLICGIDGDETKKDILNNIAPSAVFYSSLQDALRAGVLEEVDVISICTPPSTHLDIILSLINSNIGKVIFCEKPIVSNISEIERLNRACKNSNTKIVPNISRRWNRELRQVKNLIGSDKFGALEKINIRYTRGIFNTGSHLFDMLKMWTGSPIKEVIALGETRTTAEPEKSINFYFRQIDGVTGYAEAINDENYYLFEFDLYCTNGKIEIRNSGDDIICYTTGPHHLFSGLTELSIDYSKGDVLNDSCMKNAVDNICDYLNGKTEINCELNDAIYPLHVADALLKSLNSCQFEEVKE